ncbi:choice-of-anchor D domain-containing protein [Blastococcus deserti]|uniref:Choice-of-anchor D domain-containing protein n=1 Tax=Blastococcus deserti TaxID=2259033 RepID=A0ABW4XCT1_9ACTN
MQDDPTAPAKFFHVHPTVLAFAPGPVGGRSGPSRVTLVNNGSAPLVVADVEIGGPHATDFAVRGGDCLPQTTLAVGAGCGIDLEATPSAVGRRTAQLRIDAAGGDAASSSSWPPASGRTRPSTRPTPTSAPVWSAARPTSTRPRPPGRGRAASWPRPAVTRASRACTASALRRRSLWTRRP